MIKVANSRAQREGNGAEVVFKHLANEDLRLLSPRQLFDGAYSNFSGLNCLSDLRPVARDLALLVRPGGRVLVCLWSRVCVGELIWYLLHGEVGKAIRRFSGKSQARLGGLTIAVSYPTAGEVQRAFAPWFEMQSRRAIGLFVPPSYVEGWAQRHVALLEHLEQLDAAFGGFPILRDVGDHVLVEFRRCNQ
jgi:hypothetical protein